MNLVLAGFGVGFSWAALACTGGPLVISDLTLVDSNALVEAASSG